MMGRTHLVSGALAWQVIAPETRMDAVQMITGLVLVPCAALLPDIDHRKATISRTYGPVTAAASWLIAKACGGHRRGTHSVVGVLLLGWLLQVCVDHRRALWALIVMCAVLIPTLAAGVRVFRVHGWVGDALPIPIAIGTSLAGGINVHAIPIAMMTGCFIHIVGDCMTEGGCPILWPFTRRRFALNLFRTGHWFETRVVFPVLVSGTVLLSLIDVWHGLM